MARKTNIKDLKNEYLEKLQIIESRFHLFENALSSSQYLLLRWASSMTAVEAYSIWERYSERRLISALNHYPDFFIKNNAISGVKSISKGLSTVLIRGGSKYFDVRSCSELIQKGNLYLDSKNPFLALRGTDILKYLDTLSSIRNYIVHNSEASGISYKKALKETFGIKSCPEPDEFLNAIDYRKHSPSIRQKRIIVIINQIEKAIKLC